MKYLPAIAATLLGLIYVFSSAVVLFHLVPTPPPPPEGSPAGHFMAAFAPTGYLTLVKVCELIGGLLVIIPKTRNIGLLILTPITVNILAFHGLVLAGYGLFSPLIIAIVALTVFLLISERRRFLGLLR